MIHTNARATIEKKLTIELPLAGEVVNRQRE